MMPRTIAQPATSHTSSLVPPRSRKRRAREPQRDDDPGDDAQRVRADRDRPEMPHAARGAREVGEVAARVNRSCLCWRAWGATRCARSSSPRHGGREVLEVQTRPRPEPGRRRGARRRRRGRHQLHRRLQARGHLPGLAAVRPRRGVLGTRRGARRGRLRLRRRRPGRDRRPPHGGAMASAALVAADELVPVPDGVDAGRRVRGDAAGHDGALPRVAPPIRSATATRC